MVESYNVYTHGRNENIWLKELPVMISSWAAKYDQSDINTLLIRIKMVTQNTEILIKHIRWI